jgi:hypothetical protein
MYEWEEKKLVQEAL